MKKINCSVSSTAISGEMIFKTLVDISFNAYNTFSETILNKIIWNDFNGRFLTIIPHASAFKINDKIHIVRFAMTNSIVSNDASRNILLFFLAFI